MPRFRNPGPYVFDLPTLGVRLLPGEEIEHPSQLAGLVLVDDNEDSPDTRGARPSRDEPAKEVL